jgi:hypothetical protein
MWHEWNFFKENDKRGQKYIFMMYIHQCTNTHTHTTISDCVYDMDDTFLGII